MTNMTTMRTDAYPSRMAPEPGLLEREDPVLHGPETGALSLYQRARYDADGFLGFPQLFAVAEVQEMWNEAEALRSREDLKVQEDVITEPGTSEIRSIFDVHLKSDAFDRILRDFRVLEKAREVLGSDVYVFQSRINYKPGFTGKEFYWHSDFETWHVEDGMPRMRTVSCSISLTDNHDFNGPLMLIPGSHRHYVQCVGETPEDNYQESLKRQETGVPDPESVRALMGRGGGIVQATAPAGSMTMFECNTMHGSNSNITPLPRANLFVVFNSVENELEDPFGGLPPRPGFLANRSNVRPLTEAVG